MNGRYMNCCRVEEESDFVIGEKGRGVEKRVWDETVDVLRGVDGRVEGVVKKYLSGGGRCF